MKNWLQTDNSLVPYSIRQLRWAYRRVLDGIWFRYMLKHKLWWNAEQANTAEKYLSERELFPMKAEWAKLFGESYTAALKRFHRIP